MKEKFTRGLVTLYIMIFLALVIEPFIMLLIQSRTCSLKINIGGQIFKVNGFVKNIEDSEKQTSYLVGNPLGYFSFASGTASSTLIEISRTLSNEGFSTPGKYAIYESWTGVTNNAHLLHILFQCSGGKYTQISFYGKENKVFNERMAFVKQIDKREFLRVPYCELAESFQKAYNTGVINRLRHSSGEDRILIEYQKALELNDKPKVLSLLTTNEIVDKKTGKGYTPLHTACLITEDIDIVNALIEKGLDVNERNSLGYTSLMLAAFSGKSGELMATLIEHGADVNIFNNDGETALHWACYSDNIKAADVLIKNGAQLEKKDALGLTPLHIASYFGYDDIINSLIIAGVDVNSNNKTGLTPLHLAAISGDVEALKLLIKAGANAKATDNQGMTCLHKAAYNANSKAVIYLANDKELVNLKDNTGKTAYDYGKLSGMGK